MIYKFIGCLSILCDINVRCNYFLTNEIKNAEMIHVFSSAQLLSHVRLFVIPWTAARQASLFITNSQSLAKLMSIEVVMPSNHLILCHPLLLLPSIFPNIRVFSNDSSLHQVAKVSTSTSVLPMNTQDRSPLGWTGWISLLSKGLSRVFSNTTVHISILVRSYNNFCLLL